jgi:hypothetical protein
MLYMCCNADTKRLFTTHGIFCKFAIGPCHRIWWQCAPPMHEWTLLYITMHAMLTQSAHLLASPCHRIWWQCAPPIHEWTLLYITMHAMLTQSAHLLAHVTGYGGNVHLPCMDVIVHALLTQSACLPMSQDMVATCASQDMNGMALKAMYRTGSSGMDALHGLIRCECGVSVPHVVGQCLTE